MLTVILKASMCLNPNWIKIYDMNHKLFWQVCFSILEEKKRKFEFQNWPLFDQLWSFLWQLHKYLSRNWDLDGHLRSLGFNWIKSYGFIIGYIIFFPAWKCIISRVKYRSKFWHLRRKLAVTFSKRLFLKKSLGIHGPYNQVKCR